MAQSSAPHNSWLSPSHGVLSMPLDQKAEGPEQGIHLAEGLVPCITPRPRRGGFDTSVTIFSPPLFVFVSSFFSKWPVLRVGCLFLPNSTFPIQSYALRKPFVLPNLRHNLPQRPGDEPVRAGRSPRSNGIPPRSTQSRTRPIRLLEQRPARLMAVRRSTSARYHRPERCPAHHLSG